MCMTIKCSSCFHFHSTILATLIIQIYLTYFVFIPSIVIIIIIIYLLVSFSQISLIITITILTNIITTDGKLCFFKSFERTFNQVWTSHRLFLSSVYKSKLRSENLVHFFYTKIISIIPFSIRVCFTGYFPSKREYFVTIFQCQNQLTKANSIHFVHISKQT